MKETTLLKIALICSLIGLVALYFISTKIDAKEYNPSKLNKNVGENVKLIGTILKITSKDNVAFIEVNRQSPVTVVVFGKENLSLKNGDTVEVLGEIQEYKGNNEIIAQKIRVIK